MSSSPEKEKKFIPKPIESPIVKQLASTSVSSSPQKSPMISISAPIFPQPVEPKIELPSYYNPNVINVNRFAEQQKKRKLLWSGKKDEPIKDTAKWGGTQFSQDADGTKASKFMRLMGIKDGN
jgi:arginine/serine-rich coiled-coil protein 2